MNGKLKVKWGSLEIDFEGSETFLKEEFMQLLNAISAVAKESGTLLTQPDVPSTVQTASSRRIGSLGMGTVAQKLAVKSGPELIMAAAAKLTFIDQKDKFTAKDLLSEMRQASAYFKESHATNFAKNIAVLVKNAKLNDVGGDAYSIPADRHEEFQSKLS
ncbi:MAG: hypothetical protein NDI63_14915 [Pseudobdellovibrio sp.]|nr:hypothetical protein [Pseudobdellovibrio sp.]